jgi:hypothetical protein
MAKQVVMGAILKCSFGAAPSALMVLPTSMVNADFLPAANIMDFAPLMNIMPFGTCSSIMNPEVIAATAAAMGVLTPMPCIPMTVAPWIPGSPTVLIGGMPALNNSCKCLCLWGGEIAINEAGTVDVNVAS